jgi:hypothetical protein
MAIRTLVLRAAIRPPDPKAFCHQEIVNPGGGQSMFIEVLNEFMSTMTSGR